jgi:hypothetical protein
MTRDARYRVKGGFFMRSEDLAQAPGHSSNWTRRGLKGTRFGSCFGNAHEVASSWPKTLIFWKEPTSQSIHTSGSVDLVSAIELAAQDVARRCFLWWLIALDAVLRFALAL